MKTKVSKKAFLSSMARKHNMPITAVNDFYEAFIEEIYSTIASGHTLTLTGFGSFYLQKHKGHPVQFDGNEGRRGVNDYLIFKFSASDVINRRFRDDYQSGNVVFHFDET